MGKILTPPSKLQVGTSFDEAIPLINNNFDNIASDFNGFAVGDVLAFPDNTSSFFLASGALGHDLSAAITTDENDDIVFIVPEVSVFIDPPPVDEGGIGYDTNYLFPTGSALTSDQLATIVSVVLCKSSSNPDFSFVGTDGRTYHLANDIFISIRNGGVSSHGYFLTINQAIYTRSSSFYR